MGRGRPEVRSSAPAQGPGSPRRWPLPPSSSPCVAGQGAVPRRGGREARCVCLFPSEPGSVHVLLGLWPCGRLVSEHQFLGVCLGPCVCVAVSSRLSFLASLHRSLPHLRPAPVVHCSTHHGAPGRRSQLRPRRLQPHAPGAERGLRRCPVQQAGPAQLLCQVSRAQGGVVLLRRRGVQSQHVPGVPVHLGASWRPSLGCTSLRLGSWVLRTWMSAGGHAGSSVIVQGSGEN